MKMLVDISRRTKFLILKASWSHVETQIQNTADHHKTNCGHGSSAVTTIQRDIGHILAPVIPEGGIALKVTVLDDRISNQCITRFSCAMTLLIST